MPLVTGSFLPTRSNIIFIVQINIFHKQYKLKKWPSTLKYLPCNVRAQRWRSCMLRNECTSKNNWRDSSSRADISNRSCPISVDEEKSSGLAFHIQWWRWKRGGYILSVDDLNCATLLSIPQIPCLEVVVLFCFLSTAIRFFFAKIISIVSINRRSNVRTSVCDTGLFEEERERE